MNNLLQGLSNIVTKSFLNISSTANPSWMPKRFLPTLLRMHQKGLEELTKYKRPKKHILDGKPFAKGVVLKNVVRKPRKPNSANRKCVFVRLSTGKEMFAYVPGIGHTLQEHNTVLCKVKKLKDTPYVKIACVRGKYDLTHVKPKK